MRYWSTCFRYFPSQPRFQHLLIEAIWTRMNVELASHWRFYDQKDKCNTKGKKESIFIQLRWNKTRRDEDPFLCPPSLCLPSSIDNDTSGPVIFYGFLPCLLCPPLFSESETREKESGLAIERSIKWAEKEEESGGSLQLIARERSLCMSQSILKSARARTHTAKLHETTTFSAAKKEDGCLCVCECGGLRGKRAFVFPSQFHFSLSRSKTAQLSTWSFFCVGDIIPLGVSIRKIPESSFSLRSID